MRSRKFIVLTSPFQNVDFVGQHGSLVAEQRDQDAEADGGFGRRYRDHEDREDLPVTWP